MSRRVPATSAVLEPPPPDIQAPSATADEPNPHQGKLRWAGSILLALFLAALPFTNFRALYNSQVSQTLSAQVGLLILAAILLPACLIVRTMSSRLSRLDGAVLLFGILIVASTQFGAARVAFLRESLYPIAFLALYFMVRWLRPTRRQWAVLVTGVAISAVSVAVVGILQRFGYEPLAYANSARTGKAQIASLLGNPNYVASLLAPATLLLVGIAFAATCIRQRIAAAVAAIPVVWCLVLTGGRAGWLGLLAGVLVMTLLLVRACGTVLRARHWAIAFAAPLLAVVLLFGVLKVAKPGFNIASRLTSTTELHLRLFPWMIGREMFLEDPIFGIGYGRFFARYDPATIEFFSASRARNTFEYALRLAHGDRPDHLHNEYFQVLVETGLLGLAAFALVLAGVACGSLRVVGHPDSPSDARRAAAILLATLACMAVDAFWGFPLRLPCSAALFWVVIALVENTREEFAVFGGLAPVPRTMTRRLFLAVLIAAVLGAGAWASVQKLNAMATRIRYWRNADLLQENMDNVRELFRAHTIGSASHPPPFEIVDYYLSRKAWDYARDSLKALSEVYSLGAKGYLQLGTVDYQRADYKAAREDFLNANILEPDSARTLEFLAHAEVQLGDLKSAEDHLQRATELDPLRPNAYHLLGVIRESAGRRSEAAGYYARAALCATTYREDIAFDPAAARRRAQELDPKAASRWR